LNKTFNASILQIVTDHYQTRKRIKGDPGHQGIKGDTGNPGDSGARGSQGQTGPQGPKGYKGIRGSQGLMTPPLLLMYKKRQVRLVKQGQKDILE